MDNYFNREFLEVLDPLGCLGMALVLREQHRNPIARNLVYDLFYDYSIKSLQNGFDSLIKRNIIAPADTKTIATLFMFCVIMGNDIRMHEHNGQKTPINCLEFYKNLKQHIINTLQTTT